MVITMSIAPGPELTLSYCIYLGEATWNGTITVYRHACIYILARAGVRKHHATLKKLNHYNNYHFNPLTPKPAVTDHATSILVGRISAGYCFKSGEKAVGRVGLGIEIRDERPSIDIFHHP
ncbi:hypothetical protein AVEN_135062-1 [Araneus ventricosus]|uniref:Uncharacterized protein n=1 Tax=Araneus ventricosus TaxID=182803 RepID=A0A4Y2D031_ARAVE|nr:hypothetical protein AVEN_135062-1 [Araneus ventricosus]